MKRRIILSIVVVIFLMTSNSLATLFEDFEDGDITNNPTWTIKVDQNGNPFGDGMVASDPVRPSNLVYKVYGEETAHYELRHQLDTGMSWFNFDITAEFMATAWNFHWRTEVANEDYTIQFSAWCDSGASPGGVNNVSLGFHHGSDADWLIIPRDQVPLNHWYKLHSWYDAGTGLFMSQLRDLETDALIGEVSGSPLVDLSLLDPIGKTSIGIEETNWQYVDNFALTPEPTTILLLGLGAVMLRKRRA